MHTFVPFITGAYTFLNVPEYQANCVDENVTMKDALSGNLGPIQTEDVMETRMKRKRGVTGNIQELPTFPCVLLGVSVSGKRVLLAAESSLQYKGGIKGVLADFFDVSTDSIRDGIKPWNYVEDTPENPNLVVETTIEKIDPFSNLSVISKETSNAYSHAKVFYAPSHFIFNVCPPELQGLERTALDYMKEEYDPFDSWLLNEQGDEMVVPTSKVDPTILEHLSLCIVAKKVALLLAWAAPHTQVSTTMLMAHRTSLVTGKNAQLQLVSSMDEYLKRCSQKEETVLIDDEKEFQCSATGSKQVMLPGLLLRAGLCGVKGCAQPHNGSGKG